MLKKKKKKGGKGRGGGGGLGNYAIYKHTFALFCDSTRSADNTLIFAFRICS
jgi:hypothetical protein